MANRKFFRLYIFFYGLMFSLSELCLGSGCSKAFLEKKVDAKKNWTCDNEADKAIKRDDYTAGISLHERFLEKDTFKGFRNNCKDYILSSLTNWGMCPFPRPEPSFFSIL